MKRPVPLLILPVLFGLGLTAFAEPADEGGASPGGEPQLKSASGEVKPVTLATLLRETADREALARWPVPAYRAMQASALKPKGRKSPGFHAGKAINNFVRIESKPDGTREWVLMEHAGPGAIVRMWSPNMAKDATFRVYLDGESSPTLTVNMMQFFYGQSPLAGPPWAELRARGGNVYLPIPFARGCKVTVDRNNCGWAPPPELFYIVQYRAYEPGTQVETFTLEGLAATAALREEIAKRLAPAAESGEHTAPWTQAQTLSPGAATAHTLGDGPAAINTLTLELGPVNPGADLPSLRDIVLMMDFDGKPAVDCPVGDFFGCGPDAAPARDTYREVSLEKSGAVRLHSRWVMPFAREARIRVQNNSTTAPVRVRISGGMLPWQWDERSMHLHAAFRSEDAIKLLPTRNFEYLSRQGRGVYVGDTLTIINPSKSWWGEGMEKISIDGEKFPSHLGTGTEDYYGYAWGDPTVFASPFHGQPRVPADPFLGVTVNTRVRPLDAIPFTRSLHFDMEVTSQDTFAKKQNQLDYAVGTMWYEAP